MRIDENKITYFISHQDEETKKKHIELYTTIRNNGKFIKSEWNGDYLVSTYEHNNTTYELCDNMEYGIMSEVVELKENQNENN